MEQIMKDAGLRKEHVKFTFQVDLEKDLQEHEVICPTCKGSGMSVAQNVYGLRGIEVPGEVFPFKRQSLSFCQHCYNGIQRKCQFCGELSARDLICKCDKAQWEHGRSRREKEKERWDKAKKITLKEAAQTYEYLYIDENDKFISPDELEEYFNDLKEDNLDAVLPIVIYVTQPTHLIMVAEDMVENFADDLHEEALDRISKTKYEELQGFLDKWCEDVKDDTTTYYPDYTTGIVLEVNQ